jgi:hypothetical protein
MAQNLTIKERKFIKAMMDHGNITQAVIDAGYKHKDRDSASSIGWNLLRKLRPHIADVLEMRGIDDTRLSKIIDDGLQAQKIEMVKDADGNQKFGMVTDHFIRHRYLETALKVKGGFAPEKKELTGKDGKPIETKSEFDLATRLLNDENANKLVHALLNIAGKPGGNGGKPEPGAVDPGEALGTLEPKAG